MFKSVFNFILNRETYNGYRAYRNSSPDAKLNTLYPMLKWGLFIVWTLLFILRTFENNLQHQPFKYTLVQYLNPIVFFHVITAYFGLIRYALTPNRDELQTLKLRYFGRKVIIWTVLAAPQVYFLNQISAHPYVSAQATAALKEEFITKVKTGDSLFVSPRALKQSAIEVYYEQRPINKEDIMKMAVSKSKKRQMVLQLDTTQGIHNEQWGYLDTEQFFKRNSAYLGTFVDIDKLKVDSTATYNPYETAYVEIKLNFKKNGLENKPMMPIPRGYINGKRYFIRRQYLSLTDSLKNSKLGE